jgi:hypothetical protein
MKSTRLFRFFESLFKRWGPIKRKRPSPEYAARVKPTIFGRFGIIHLLACFFYCILFNYDSEGRL